MREPIRWDFRVNTLLGTPGGTRHQHPRDIMYAYINMVDGKSAGGDEDNDTRAEMSTNNTLKVTEDQLSEERKQAMAQAIDGFKEACL